MMNYTEITDKVFDIYNAFIPEVFALQATFEKELAALPDSSNLIDNLNKSNALRKEQNEKVAGMIKGILSNTLPGIVECAALWYKGTERPKTERVWVISPYEFDIMGQSVVSVALQQEEKLEMSVFANFTSREVFTAAIGEGAQLDNKKLNVNDKQLSAQSSAMQCIIPPATVKGNYAALVAPLIRKFNIQSQVNKVAENLPYYLTLVARGEMDIVLSTGFTYHDVAAAICIAEHAGAVITDFAGGSKGLYTGESLLCCNEKIFAEVKAFMK